MKTHNVMTRATVSLLSISMLSAGAFGCSEAPTPVAEPKAQASLALSYRPSDAPTDKMIAEAQAKVRPGGDDVEGLLNLAVLLMRRRRETSKPALMLYAKDAIRTALSIDKDNALALTLQGMVHQYDHEFEAARDTAKRIIKINANTPLAHLVLGDAYLELGEYDAAVDAYQMAVDLRPNLQSYNRAAHVSWLHGDKSTAIELTDMAIDSGSMRDPESSAWCTVDLGDIFRHSGQTPSALAAADSALKRLPGYVPALVLRARSLAAAGKPQDAIAAYQQALERLPTVDSLLEQAELLNAVGKTKQASRRLADAVELSKDDPRPLAHYYARHNIHMKDALRLVKQELRARKNIAAWDTYALVLIRSGNLEEAEKALARATALNTPLAELHLHRALLMHAKGDLGAAKKSLTDALRINPLADRRLVNELQAAL